MGYLEWPAIDSMPVLGDPENSTPLPYENRGLLTADQPWSGNYTVNAMTWAIAQLTDFTSPPTSTEPVALSRHGHRLPASGVHEPVPPPTIAVPTSPCSIRPGPASTTPGKALATPRSSRPRPLTRIRPSSSMCPAGPGFPAAIPACRCTSGPATSTSARSSMSRSSGCGTAATPPPRLWRLTATRCSPGSSTRSRLTRPTRPRSTSQAPGSASASPPPPTPPASAPLGLPYHDSLATPGPNAGGLDDEPQYLAAQDGSFEIVPCATTPPGGYSTCTGQTTARGNRQQRRRPPGVLEASFVRRPLPVRDHRRRELDQLHREREHAPVGESAWLGLGRPGRVLHRASQTRTTPVFSTGSSSTCRDSGTWQLIDNSTSAASQVILDSGTFTNFPSGTNATGWNNLSLSFSNGSACSTPAGTIHVTITASIDNVAVSTDTVCTTSGGLGGIEAGYTNSAGDTWPAVQYSGLSVTSP